MSSISRSLSDVPEEGSENSPYLNSTNNPATSSSSTLGPPSASASGSRSGGSKTRTPSIRTLGRSSSETASVPSITVTSVKRNPSSSSNAASSSSKSRKAVTPSYSVPRIKSIPTLPHDKNAEPVPSTAMHWSRAPVYGAVPQRAMRAHTMTLVDTTAWLFGGNDDKEVNKDMKDMYCFDVETMQWTIRETTGDIPPPCRAHTTTLVDRKLVVFGGGHGIQYYDKVYIFDTVTRHWTQPAISGPLPTPRRAHSAVLYQQKIWIFGGGTGLNALNDVWTLDVSSFSRMKWEEVKTTGRTPKNRGYHTANLVGNLMIVVGGSDGKDFFTDVWCLDLDTRHWSQVTLLTAKYKRIAHSATQVGSFLFITGGFNGEEYCSDVLPFNLVSLTYEPRVAFGKPPSGRGYHSTILADSRIFLFGGFDGTTSFDDVYILDLAAGAYLPQVTSFNIELV
ncbi:putative kelch motif containing protein [Lyophyllum shimeji]|uniref:Kelch motif containing protein n=1 Tax=Lyophyllum shimeji TaxID=47721 RepID=A0A9P3UUC9_LYOSH|nr:putative kelch motif containing protein [Lyophyllum shimeji]